MGIEALFAGVLGPVLAVCAEVGLLSSHLLCLDVKVFEGRSGKPVGKTVRKRSATTCRKTKELGVKMVSVSRKR